MSRQSWYLESALSSRRTTSSWAIRRGLGARALGLRRFGLRSAVTIVVVAAAPSIVACREQKPNLPSEPAPTSAGDAGSLAREELIKPEACKACHPAQFAEWAGSMHAYAALDPVFVAMNARGQEETQGKLGTFCVNCHAPMAVNSGLTEDGLNLAKLPPEYQGVTCYFCHNVEAVEGDHNNPLRLANDTLMRGPFSDPAPNVAHASSFSSFLDKDDPKSAQLCGACHDVVVDAHALGATRATASVAIEQTFQEWKQTLFNQPSDVGGLSCNGCHMPIASTRDRSAIGDGLPERRSRRHDFEGVDLALVPFPGVERQRLLAQQFLDSSLLGEICVSRDGLIAVTLENSAGHHWPSGATFDRLGWLFVEAYDEAGLVFRTTEPEAEISIEAGKDAGRSQGARGGVVDGGRGVDGGASAVPGGRVVGTPAPTLTQSVLKADGSPAHFFWEIAEIESQTSLPGVITRDPLSPDYHVERRSWQFDTQQADFDSIDEVRLTVRLRPIKREVLHELVTSGHLDGEVAARMSTFDLLPQRCHTADEVERFSDILVGAVTDCDAKSPEHATTLTWVREQAVPGNRNFRQIVIEGAPASCLAHPTYIPPAP